MQTKSSFDLFLIFVGANVVATTFQVGASLAPAFRVRDAPALIAISSAIGAAPVAARVALGVVEHTRFLSEKQDFMRLFYRGNGGKEEQTL